MNDNDKKRTKQLKELIDDAKSEGEEVIFAASSEPKNKIEREKIKELFLKSIENGDYVIKKDDILIKVPEKDEIGFRAWLEEENTDLERKSALKSLIEKKDTKKNVKVGFRATMPNENYKGECEK